MGLGPKTGRPRNARSILSVSFSPDASPGRLSFRMPCHPDASPGPLSSRMPRHPDVSPGHLSFRMPRHPFPVDNSTKHSCQPSLHDINISSHTNQSPPPPRLQRNRKTLSPATLSGKRLHKKKNKSPFPK